MAGKLKDLLITRVSLRKFADEIKKQYPAFDRKRFITLVFDGGVEKMELMAKMRHTTECLQKTLPESIKQTGSILKKAAPHVKGWEAFCLPDYFSLYGLEDRKLSLNALATFTKYSSSEFAIRPFLIREPKPVMAWMKKLATDKNHHIRRFASEGCRPRLPWAMAIPGFKKDPGLILPVLERLKADESEYVRKSVANNLNDISKDHPQLVLDICKTWQGHSRATDWIIKHGCRTLLKAGNRQAMRLFGFVNPRAIVIERLKLRERSVRIGEDLNFVFEVKVTSASPVLLRLEYAIYYAKAKNKISKKVFMISEKRYPSGVHPISRKQSFADKSTRKHYPGNHEIAIISNGVEKSRIGFQLGK